MDTLLTDQLDLDYSGFVLSFFEMLNPLRRAIRHIIKPNYQSNRTNILRTHIDNTSKNVHHVELDRGLLIWAMGTLHD